MNKILIINGPSIDKIALRDSSIYGDISYEEIVDAIVKTCKIVELDVAIKQSNSEGDVIDLIHNAYFEYDGIIINAGGYSHTSVSIRDALEMYNKPKIEVHMSNIYKREEFRRKSLLSEVVDGVICGFGGLSYAISVMTISKLLEI